MQDQVQRHKLLLADDSVTIQKVVNLTFADEGIDVVSVGDGDSALDMLREDLPDIVLADVNMPGITGYEICAKIKEGETGERIPVVLLVGSFEPFDEDEAARVGADGYLTKPFQSISQLVDKVAELLGTSETAEEFADAVPGDFGWEPDHGEAADTGHVESRVTSFPIPFEGSITSGPESGSTEPDQFEQGLLGSEPETGAGFSEFSDMVDAEMSEAFAEEEASEETEAFVQDEPQIEEVNDDFFKTQPLTDSDLKEISVEHPETRQGEADEYEDLSAWAGQTDFGPPDESSPDAGGSGSDDEHQAFEAFGDAAETEGQLGQSHEEAHEQAYEEAHEEVHEEEKADGEEGGQSAIHEKSFIFTSSERFEETFEKFEVSSLSSESESEDAPHSEPQTESEGIGDYDSAPAFPPSDSDVPLPEGITVLDLDELNLLELPPVENGEEEEEFEPSDQSDADSPPTDGQSEQEVEAETAAQPEWEAPPAEDAVETEQTGFDAAPEPVPASINGRPMVESVSENVSHEQGLSRETVEAITQRVIEVLSEKAIREIAWEVVPDMAELIIKKMAEDKLKN